jgi:hypothetical protein
MGENVLKFQAETLSIAIHRAKAVFAEKGLAASTANLIAAAGIMIADLRHMDDEALCDGLASASNSLDDINERFGEVSSLLSDSPHGGTKRAIRTVNVGD